MLGKVDWSSEAYNYQELKELAQKVRNIYGRKYHAVKFWALLRYVGSRIAMQFPKLELDEFCGLFLEFLLIFDKDKDLFSRDLASVKDSFLKEFRKFLMSKVQASAFSLLEVSGSTEKVSRQEERKLEESSTYEHGSIELKINLSENEFSKIERYRKIVLKYHPEFEYSLENFVRYLINKGLEKIYEEYVLPKVKEIQGLAKTLGISAEDLIRSIKETRLEM